MGRRIDLTYQLCRGGATVMLLVGVLCLVGGQWLAAGLNGLATVLLGYAGLQANRAAGDLDEVEAFIAALGEQMRAEAAGEVGPLDGLIPGDK